MKKKIITLQDLIDDRNATKMKANCNNEDIFRFIEQFCYIKDKKTNIYKPIKLSNLQKKFINYQIYKKNLTQKNKKNKKWKRKLI
jgi:hypothetical protein